MVDSDQNNRMDVSISGVAKGEKVSQGTIGGGLLRFTNNEMTEALNLGMQRVSDGEPSHCQKVVVQKTLSDSVYPSPAMEATEVTLSIDNGKLFADGGCLEETSNVTIPKGGTMANVGVVVSSGEASLTASSAAGNASLSLSAE